MYLNHFNNNGIDTENGKLPIILKSPVPSGETTTCNYIPCNSG